MAEPRTTSSTTGRLAVYSYLRPLVEGRRVLELGSGTGEGAAHLMSLGARAVCGSDDDASALDGARRRLGRTGLSFVPRAALRESGPFDVVIVPDATSLLRGGERALSGLRELLGTAGRLVCRVPNGDAGGAGLGYYDVFDALSPHFPLVRMFGQTPFAAFGIAEFDDASGGLRVESGLVAEADEQPEHYLAVAGPGDAIALGYALVQVPLPALAGAPAPAATPAAPIAGDGELRRKLAEAQGEIEGVLRVSRAQAEEIEELRARLRRAADSRAELDEEVSRLRRALADNNESVVNLTKRTTEEMTALAQRLTAGLRGGPAREETPQTAALLEKLREREAALAARESALSDRDERIAALEAERQDLAWRLDAAEDDLRRAGGPATLPARAPREDDLLATLQTREQALEEYRRAASAHVDEVARLRDALGEQSAAVSELEESLAQAEKRLAAAEQEAARLRKQAAETEEADRQRRSRLAELEGTLLRLQRQAAVAAPSPATNGTSAPAAPARAPASDEISRLSARVRELETEVERLRDELTDTERSRDEAELRWDEAAGRIVGLERAAAEKDELAHTEEALRARISELEGRADGGRLHTALAEVDRLRAALERSEEQLWEARGRLLANRERLEAFERMTVSSEGLLAEPASVPADVLEELSALESGLRAEAARLASIERSLSEWRMALANGGAAPEAAPPPGES